MVLQTPTPPAIPVAPTAPVEAPVAQGPTTLSGLEAQAAQLRVQLAGLDAQWGGLKSQLDQMLRNNPARPGVQQKWADVAVQRAQVQGDLARVEAQIAQMGGLPGVPTVPPRNPRVPRFGNSGFPIGAVVFMAMLVPISMAWARRIGRSNPRPVGLSREATERLERMEQAIDAVAIEVERISEGQRFVTKILAERPRKSDPQKPAEQSSSPAPQVRALGAGPAEMLEIPEREATPEQVRHRSQ